MATKSHFIAVAAVLTVAALAMGGCAAQAQPAESGGAADGYPVDETVAALVPDSIRESGILVIGTNAPYPPLEYFAEDNETLIGFDIDLGDALAQTMGLESEWKNVSFDNIIPGLEGGRYDVGIAGFGIEAERLDVVDFVSYYFNGGGFFVLSSSDFRPTGFDTSLCGYRIAVQKGTSQVKRLDLAQAACTSAGDESIEVLQIPDQTQVALTLTSDRADAVVADLAAVEYTVAQSDGTFCVSGLYKTAHSLAGIAIPKDDEGAALTEAVKAALDVLAESGAYDEIAEEWGVIEGAVETFDIYDDPAGVSTSEEVTPFAPKAGCDS